MFVHPEASITVLVVGLKKQIAKSHDRRYAASQANGGRVRVDE